MSEPAPEPTGSYVHGASTLPLLGETIGANFDRTVSRWGDRPGLIVPPQGVRWSYRELGARVDAFAAGLLALGLRPGDRVGIWSPNNAEWVITQFATAKAGLILVNINPAYRLAELDYALNKVGCRALITATGSRPRDYVGMLASLAPELAHALPGRLSAARLASLRDRHPDRRAARPRHDRRSTQVRGAGGCHRTARAWPRSRRGCSSTTRSTSSSPPARPGRPRAPR